MGGNKERIKKILNKRNKGRNRGRGKHQEKKKID